MPATFGQQFICFADRFVFTVEQFALVTETSAMPKGGQNLELAHHVLFHSAGDVLFALQVLLRKNHLSSFLARHSALRNYHYQNSDIWSPDEIIIFSNALMKHDKDFFLVAGEVWISDYKV